MIKAVETGLCEARLKELELFRLEKARDNLKNPTPETNYTNPMSASTLLPSAAFLRRGDGPALAIAHRHGHALVMLWAFC